MLNSIKKKSSYNEEYVSTLLDKIKTIVDSQSDKPLTNDMQKKYNIISRAIKEKRKVEITYYSFNKGLNTRIIHPFELFYLDSCFAVASFCETKKDLRHFELKRIKKIKPLKENY